MMMMMLFTREFLVNRVLGECAYAGRESVCETTEQLEEAIEKSKSTRSFARNAHA